MDGLEPVVQTGRGLAPALSPKMLSPTPRMSGEGITSCGFPHPRDKFQIVFYL